MIDLEHAVPTAQDDPRLDNWYHTIELPGGLTTHGVYDHRPVLPRYRLPASLEGMTALDVGTADGFFAFELERRGATSVTAIDVDTWGDFDWTPQVRETKGDKLAKPMASNFRLASSWRQSQAKHLTCSVYDLSAEKVGTFDLVFCGSLLLHLMSPLRALANIRTVTTRLAVIETIVDDRLDNDFPDRPWIHFGVREVERLPGENCFYWRFGTRALEELLVYAGFSRIERHGRFKTPFRLPPETGGPGWTHAVIHAYV